MGENLDEAILNLRILKDKLINNQYPLDEKYLFSLEYAIIILEALK